MKKILLLLFLIPNLVMAEESKWKKKVTPILNINDLDPSEYTVVETHQERFQKWLDANPDKAGTEDYITVQKALEEYKQPTFNVEAARAAGLSEEEIQALIAAGPPPELTEERTTSVEQERSSCAAQSARAKSDFAAKKIYETCLDLVGVPKK
ncbi:hypothetical protein N9489_03045 [Methylophilaceae bacterium]|nr:hypothetical protein [Methylophilaceae bacterium]